jgi:transposase
MILFEKFGQHRPFNRQAERYTREGVPLSLSTLANQVGAAARRWRRFCGASSNMYFLPIACIATTRPCRFWPRARPTPGDVGSMCATTGPSAARRRRRRCSIIRATAATNNPPAHLRGYAGIFQADAYGGYTKLYEANPKPSPLVGAVCWVHAHRPFFVMADIAAAARRKVEGKTTSVISPLALEAVRRIVALFDIERAINGQSAEQRCGVRQELSVPLLADLERWLREQRPKLSRGNDLGKAMDYSSSSGWHLPGSSTTAASA